MDCADWKKWLRLERLTTSVIAELIVLVIVAKAEVVALVVAARAELAALQASRKKIIALMV